MSMEYIRRYYRVTAKRGMRITFDGEPATIIGSRGPLLRVRMDSGPTYLIHPHWRVEYPVTP